VVRATEEPGASELDLQHFLQRLALRLTSWETTSFLIGEFAEGESRNPVFTVADGVVWLLNEIERNSTTRKLRVTKIRGQAPLPGLHTFRLSKEGAQVFPRVPATPPKRQKKEAQDRLSTGVSGLDDMMGGGIVRGDSIMVAGPTGSGKTILATQFVAAGRKHGERAVVVVFEEDPGAYLQRATDLGLPLQKMVDDGMLEIVYLRPLDLSVDETLQAIREQVERLGAARVVVDSMTGFEVALASGFRQDFRESFYRLLRSLTSLDVTVMSTVEVVESSDYLRFAPYNVSFLADDIVAMRYVELHGELRRVLSVIKMRLSAHSPELRLYELTSHGLEMGGTLREYTGIITGVPRRED
jgi:circadian clock protein KaiC